MPVRSEVEREVCLGLAERIPLGEGRTFCVRGHAVAVFRLRDGGLYAVQAACPHAGGPLAEGLAGGGTVLCPLHGWKFDLRTGACLNQPDQRLAVYPVREEGGRLYLRLPGEG